MLITNLKRYKAIAKNVRVYFRDKVVWHKNASVLMYHSVADNGEFFTVSPESFHWQIKYLKENNFNVIPLAVLLGLIKNKKKIPPKTVILTFDDGYEDNYINVFPILKRFNFPATIFLTTGRIGDKKYTNKRNIKLPMLDWTQIKEMHASGFIDFEPHTVNHPKLTKINLGQAEEEIISSKEAIEKGLDKKCDFFAYPYGLYNKEIERVVSKNFSVVLTVRQGFVSRRDNLLNLARNSVDSVTGKLRFKLEI